MVSFAIIFMLFLCLFAHTAICIHAKESSAT